MREIKFRAWDKAENIMLSDILVGTDDYTDLLNETIEYLQDKVVLMQYTGLEDKDGKEIYEGDILTNGREFAEVIFDKGCFMAKIEKDYMEALIDFCGTEHYKVIGNIYENPELGVEE